MSELRRFVEKRMGEETLPPPVRRAYESVLATSLAIRSDGEADDWFSWLSEDSVAWKIGEYILGADPASEAERVSDSLLAALARTWEEHPDHDDAWNKLIAEPD